MQVKSESEVTQSCPTLSDPMDCSLPSSSVHGIFQARVLEWGAIAFSSCLSSTWLKSGSANLQSSRKICLPHSSNLRGVAAKSLQSCPTRCDPIDGSPPGSPIPGILQARTLEWVAISFSNACEWKVKVKSLSRVRLLATPWTAAYQAPPSMGFSRQDYWSGVPLPSPWEAYSLALILMSDPWVRSLHTANPKAEHLEMLYVDITILGQHCLWVFMLEAGHQLTFMFIIHTTK